MRKNRRDTGVMTKHDPGQRRIGELQLVAERLNNNKWYLANSSDSYLRETYDAYKIVEKIVSSDSLAHAVKLFTIHAAAHPIKLEVGVGRMAQTGEETAVPGICTPLNEIESALGLLWRAYFHAKGWTRLKPCPICHTWFVDQTSDARKARCSVLCTNRWWSYSKRKQADYTRFKKGGYHGTKTHR